MKQTQILVVDTFSKPKSLGALFAPVGMSEESQGVKCGWGSGMRLLQSIQDRENQGAAEPARLRLEMDIGTEMLPEHPGVLPAWGQIPPEMPQPLPGSAGKAQAPWDPGPWMQEQHLHPSTGT